MASPVLCLFVPEQVEILGHTNHPDFVQVSRVSVADCRCSLHLVMRSFSLPWLNFWGGCGCPRQLAKEGGLPGDLSCLWSCDWRNRALGLAASFCFRMK